MLRRYLALTESTDQEIAALSFPHLIRLASRRKLIASDWETRSVYRSLRNKTPHAYSQKVAVEVMQKMPAFLVEIRTTIETLHAKIKDHQKT